MNILKNPFASSPSSAETTSKDPSKVVKRWQLEQGRARKQAETLTAELETASRAFEQAERVLGQTLLDDQDPTAAAQDAKQAGDRVRSLELSLVAAKEKDEAALVELQRAKRQVETEDVLAALSHLKHVVSPEMDQHLENLERFVAEKLSPALEAARIAVGSGIQGNFLSAAILGLEQCLFHSCRGLIKSSNVYAVLLRYKKWSDYIPEPQDIIQLRDRNGRR